LLSSGTLPLFTRIETRSKNDGEQSGGGSLELCRFSRGLRLIRLLTGIVGPVWNSANSAALGVVADGIRSIGVVSQFER
tara:strand:- start:1816 stop:2052 length:237 start_codon:yes stop_codon:yes gene_type:complete